MPSRKQRRRREKSLRHEYEYVYVDGEGREVDEAPIEDEPPAKRRDAARDRPERTSAPTRAPRRGVEPPSWRRTLRRAGFLGPLMFVMVYLLNRDYSMAQNIVTTITLLLVFVPFSYLLDSLMWRAYRRRIAANETRSASGRTSRRRTSS